MDCLSRNCIVQQKWTTSFPTDMPGSSSKLPSFEGTRFTNFPDAEALSLKHTEFTQIEKLCCCIRPKIVLDVQNMRPHIL